MTVAADIERPETTPVSLSDSAARRISKILSKETEGAMLRISVEGGGCSGFQYTYELVTTRADDDLVLEKDGATVLIDSVSLPYMEGSVIDFVDDLMGQAFKIENPNATASCGCGTSFSM
ncbi:iron-sulfur cluster assembly accessory protein [Breoghania corrubedonensis]|uniref:Iron-sulfur cluster assembly accessory protein n=1 Tax=Breoghania corrubedonensis TaxID=665038 RepID=A0A2T5V8I0_9HYPH|nr:iron-sulfur cluster insertion protein ErpA [Breoghania corrubedonensis]PTW60034.1 iron-sulfur cluster assembly accessory protein [Breoghania corrubedonensis]